MFLLFPSTRSAAPRCAGSFFKPALRAGLAHHAKPGAMLAGLGLLFASVLGLQAQSSVILGWNALTNSGVTGYRIYRGTASQSYTTSTDVGNVTQFTVPGL